MITQDHTEDNSNKLFIIVLVQIILFAFLLNNAVFIAFYLCMVITRFLSVPLPSYSPIIIFIIMGILVALVSLWFSYYMYRKAEKGKELSYRLRIVFFIALPLAFMYILWVIWMGVFAALGSTGFR